MLRQRKHTKDSWGQGIVEFALVIPVLLLILLGIFEAGRMLWIYNAVSTASREAARVGSSVSDNGSGTPYYLDCDAIRLAAKRLGDPGQVEDADVTISYDHGPGTASIGNCPVSASAISLGDRVIVTVIGHFDPAPAIPLFTIPSFDITSVTRRTIIKGAELGVAANTSTPGGPTNTPSGPTNTPSGPTATATATVSPTNTVSVPTNTPSPTSSEPGPPVYVDVSWTQDGNKCKWPIITVGANSSWSSNPGYGPSNYQIFENGSAADYINSNYPGNATWNTWDTWNNNTTVTYSFVGIFNWPVTSDPLALTFLCDKGDFILQ